MLLFDLTTTSINNYMDFKKPNQTYKYQHNVIGRENISEATVRNLIFAMLAGTLLIGLYLTFVAGWLLLVMGLGGLFYRGLYTFWPHSVIADAFSEVFSGVTMGLGILPSRSISHLIKKCFIWLDLRTEPA